MTRVTQVPMRDTKIAEATPTPVRTEPLPLEFPGVHYMGQEEIDAAVRVLSSRSLFRYYGIDLQNEADAFETEFAAFLGVKRALAVGSGTGALSVALSALGVGPGQQIIVPAYLWVSVAAAVVNQGAIPVLADIDETFTLDPASLEDRITPRTTGVILVHMSGAAGDAPAIRAIADRRGLFLLEDCAQACGGSIGGKALGTFGDIGIFSFQMNKNMTSGEGGCLVTEDENLYRRAFASHDLGYARTADGRLAFEDRESCLWGRGYRMDELRAAVLRVQLRKLPAITAAMRSSKYRIRASLANFPEVQLRRIIDPSGDTGCFLITTYATAEVARRVNESLKAEGIRTYPQGISNVLMTDWGLHLYYNNVSLVRKTSVSSNFPWDLAENRGLVPEYSKGTCPVADSLFERSILLPIPSSLSTRDEDDIIRAFEKVLTRELACV
ncbi:MAG: DegT/DnrJ/EryC1/StrS family aminotransferase [Acidobacteriaceae bacterium]|nr:DegT/DnrJ/EryC1/StrS family aminotransferase [Acidobacteriaceae bacterium]